MACSCLFGQPAGRASHFDTVKERYSCVVTTAGAIETVVEDPALSILKNDSDITASARNFGGPYLKDHAASPGTEFLMEHLIPHMEVGVMNGLLRPARILLRSGRIPYRREAFFLSHLRCTQNHWSGYWRIIDSMV